MINVDQSALEFGIAMSIALYSWLILDSSSRARAYLKENWGAPLIIAFMALLIAAAVSLSIGLSDLANRIAIYAYFALVLGVLLQIDSYVWSSRKKKNEQKEI